MSLKGIDVSSNNGKIDWKEASKHIDFAILRCHQKYGIDSTFEDNYNGCITNNVPVGVYKYSYAKTIGEARKEAREVLKVLGGRRLQLPVFYDFEWDDQIMLGELKIQKIALAFMRIIMKEGYGVGIYCNKDWYNSYVSAYLKKYYAFWIASYPKKDVGEIETRLEPKNVLGWQYTEKGTVPGVNGEVDKDVFYCNMYSTEMPFVEEKSDAIFTSGPKTGVTVEDALNIARSWLGLKEADGSHRQIIDIYNSFLPHPRSYQVTYSDAWCDATVSAIFIRLGATDIIGGIECGVEEHIKKFMAAGIWIEDGSITPKPGDLITYNWEDSTQPNDGYADHIGIVESVVNGQITTIEGNVSDMVKRCYIPVGYGKIRGFARPKYVA